jgi:hypothetical protein
MYDRNVVSIAQDVEGVTVRAFDSAFALNTYEVSSPTLFSM